MSAVPLLALQQQFSEVIRLGSSSPGTLCRLGILDQGGVSAQERVRIYQRAYQIRLREALEEDFPETQELLGEEEFADLVQAYLAAYPSCSWTLAELGSRLPEFVVHSKWCHEFPFLADLVHLEWSRVLAAHARRIEPVDISILLNKEELALLKIELALAPSVQLLTCDWAVHRDRMQKLTWLVVYCHPPTDEVCELEVTSDQWALLNQIAAGLSVQDVISVLPDVLPDQLTQWFFHWVSQGIVVCRI